MSMSRKPAPVWSRIARPTRLASLAIAIALILLAQYATTHGMVSKFILPVPTAVGSVLVEGFASGFYTEHLLSTLVSMLAGFAIAAAIVIGVTVFLLVIVASIEQLSCVPANVYGYAAAAAYGVSGGGIANVTAANMTNPLITVAISMVIGAVLGMVSGKVAAALTKKA